MIQSPASTAKILTPALQETEIIPAVDHPSSHSRLVQTRSCAAKAGISTALTPLHLHRLHPPWHFSADEGDMSHHRIGKLGFLAGKS